MPAHTGAVASFRGGSTSTPVFLQVETHGNAGPRRPGSGKKSLLSWQPYTLKPEPGTPVVPFCPFHLGVSLLKLNSRKKGTLIINGLLGNLVSHGFSELK